MGTHPIFESDFDCLTDLIKMSLAGSWKKVKVDNGMAFGKAIGATDEQLAAQAQAVSTVTYEVNGNNIKVTRVHKIGDKEIKTVNQADIGSEGEFETQGKKIKCKVSGSTSDVQMVATSGWANASAKIVGNQLVESITHNESNTTLTTYWDKA